MQPPTELLFRVDASALRRILGIFRSDSEYAARDGQLRSVDTLAGGRWWRNEDDGFRNGKLFLEWFFKRYLAELTKTVGCHGWFTDVKQKPEHQPAYYLVFLTRHPVGVEVFGDALSLALEKWRKTVFEEAIEEQVTRTGQYTLIAPEDQLADDERKLAAQWHETIDQNLRALLRTHDRFAVREYYNHIFGNTIGLARTKHLREALRRLTKEGITTSDSRGDVYEKIVVRAPGVTP